MSLTFQAIPIGAGAVDRHGALVLDNGELVAVVARLDDVDQELLVGQWAIEAAFGRLALDNTVGRTFEDRDSVGRWLSANLKRAHPPAPGLN